MLPYNPPDEPYLDQQGREGAAKYIHAYPLRTLVQDYRHNGEEASLELAGKILKFILKPGMWENTTLEGYKGNEHAIFGGHFHANVGALLAQLDSHGLVSRLFNAERLVPLLKSWSSPSD